MKRMLNAFLLVCFSVVFLSGCKKGGKTDQAPVSAAIGKPEDRKIDLTKLNPEEKNSVLLKAADLKTLIKMNLRAKQVITAIWRVYWDEPKLQLANPFDLANIAILSAYSADGIPLKADKAQKCSQAQVEILDTKEIQKDGQKIKQPIYYGLKDGNCTKSTDPIRAKIQKLENGSFQVNFRRDSEIIGMSLEMFGVPQIDTEKTTTEVRAFKFIKGEDSVEPVCRMTPNPSGDLKKLECYNLGQNKTETQFLSLNHFVWLEGDAEQQLKAIGMNVRVRDEGQPLVEKTFEIIDFPAKGEVKITEMQGESGKEKETRIVPVPADDKVVPTKTQAFMTNPEAQNDKEAIAAAAKSWEQNLNEEQEPAVISGDQAVDPNQISSEGEIVPLESIAEPSTQEAPVVR